MIDALLRERVSQFGDITAITDPLNREALLTALLQNEALLAQTDISSLRILGSGSAPLAPSLLQGWHDTYGIRIINFYCPNDGVTLVRPPKVIPDPAVLSA